MGSIFISYSQQDKAYAYKLHEALLKQGFDAWADDRMDDGVIWPNGIEARLKECDVFILVMSPAAKASAWVQSELRLAMEWHKTIFPLRLESDVWLEVFRLPIVDARGDKLPDTHFYMRLAEISRPGIPRHSSSLAPSLDTAAERPITPPAAVKIGENHRAKSPAKTFTERTPGNVNPRQEHARPLIITNLLGLVVVMVATIIVLKPWLSTSAQTIMPTNKPTTILSATPLPLEITMQGAKMVLVPAGPFTMGSDKGRENEKPGGILDIPTFYMDAYEVTNVLYKACVTAQTCQPPRALSSPTRSDYYSNAAYDQYPVIYVDWEKAKTYCEWRGARLPSEAEWEKAARGSDGRTYPWGENIDYTYANANANKSDSTAVGSYESGKSPYGAYDMAGNVWEWVDNWYDDYPGSATNTNFAQTRRVMRGGGWSSSNSNVRSVTRLGGSPSYSGFDVGFRCARSVP